MVAPALAGGGAWQFMHFQLSSRTAEKRPKTLLLIQRLLQILHLESIVMVEYVETKIEPRLLGICRRRRMVMGGSRGFLSSAIATFRAMCSQSYKADWPDVLD